MLYFALVYMVVALIAAVIALTGMAGENAELAWILFVIGVALSLVFWWRARWESR